MTIAYDDHPDPQPEDLHEWTARGFTVSEARRWIDNGFLMSSAGRWRDSGVYTPGDAFAWRTAGLTPYTVQPLLRAGMTPRDAVQWHELGYTHAEAAERHLAGERPRPRSWWRTLFGRRPQDSGVLTDEQSATMRGLLHADVPAATARAYLDAGWRDATDAVPWARTGIDPAQAAAYRSIGFTSAEASDLAEAGHAAFDLIQRWWDAGIPRSEVPAWAVAGFTPDDARHARDTGTTAEQAAVLRALGGQTDPKSHAEGDSNGHDD
jgi:hypothetical protein